MKSPMTKQPDETCITQQNHKEAQLFTAKHGYIPLSTELAIFYCSTWIVLSEIRSVNPSSSSWHIWNISPRMLQCSLEHKVCERTSAPHLIFQLLWLNLKKGFSKCFPSVEISTFNTESNQLSWPGRKCKLRLNLTGFPPSNLQRWVKSPSSEAGVNAVHILFIVWCRYLIPVQASLSSETYSDLTRVFCCSVLWHQQ